MAIAPNAPAPRSATTTQARTERTRFILRTSPRTSGYKAKTAGCRILSETQDSVNWRNTFAQPARQIFCTYENSQIECRERKKNLSKERFMRRMFLPAVI